MKASEDISQDELRQRVIFTLARPAVQMAAKFRVPLKDLLALVETAYFQVLRNEGMTLKSASEALDVSPRTAARLAKQLRESFALSDVLHNLPRRIEFMLRARPMSEARVTQVLPSHSREEVRAALDQLLSEGRIEPRKGRTLEYVPVKSVRKLPRDTWFQRIGGLSSFAGNLLDAVFGRFFDDEPKAFARTLSFKLPEGGEKRLQEWYEEAVFQAIVELDNEAKEATDSETMQLSLCWAPYEYVERKKGDSE